MFDSFFLFGVLPMTDMDNLFLAFVLYLESLFEGFVTSPFRREQLGSAGQ